MSPEAVANGTVSPPQSWSCGVLVGVGVVAGDVVEGDSVVVGVSVLLVVGGYVQFSTPAPPMPRAYELPGQY